MEIMLSRGLPVTINDAKLHSTCFLEDEYSTLMCMVHRQARFYFEIV